jgi:hypothetical protein
MDRKPRTPVTLFLAMASVEFEHRAGRHRGECTIWLYPNACRSPNIQ